MESIFYPGIVFLIIAFLLVSSLGSSSSTLNKIRQEQEKLNQKLDLLLKHSGIEFTLPNEIPKPLLPELKNLLELRKKVQAIKLLREHTGMSLLDAKNAVEKLDRWF
jgi:hypothetical protein